MRRRSFISGMVSATTIGIARAQQSAKQYRIAIRMSGLVNRA
jgi:hypothetical protein